MTITMDMKRTYNNWCKKHASSIFSYSTLRMCEDCKQDLIGGDHQKTLYNNYKRIVQLVQKVLQYVWEGPTTIVHI
jgi:hypothetical protein